MNLKLYYAPMSSSVRVFWALEELGVPFEKVKLDLAAKDQRKPEYLALNPNGKVPLLVVDGTPIFESLAILLFLGETFGTKQRLFPAEGMERAIGFKWMAWSAVTIGEAVSRLLRNTSDRFPESERNANAAIAAKKDIGEYLAILNAALEGKTFLVGDHFTLIDLTVSGWMPFLGRQGIDFNPYPHLNAWVGRCIGRPALARAMVG